MQLSFVFKECNGAHKYKSIDINALNVLSGFTIKENMSQSKDAIDKIIALDKICILKIYEKIIHIMRIYTISH